MSSSDARHLDAELDDAERRCACGGNHPQSASVTETSADPDYPHLHPVVTVPLHSLKILLRFVRPAADAEALTDTERSAYDRLAAAAGRF